MDKGEYVPPVIDSPIDSKFLLVGGTGRSGTTVLSRTLARHSMLSQVPEWRFLSDPDGVLDFYNQNREGTGSPFHYDRRLKRLKHLLNSASSRHVYASLLGPSRVREFSARRLHRNPGPPYGRTDVRDFAPNFRQASARLLESLTTFSYEGYWVGMQPLEATSMVFADLQPDDIAEACAEFLRDVAQDVCLSQGVKHHLENSTWTILWFHRILELLPEARLVHITRDPRDVIASYGQQSWAPSDRIQAAKVYQTVMETWWRISEQVPSNTYLEVRLEDLVADPKSVLLKICDSWGIEFEPQLLEQQLSSASFGRWRRDLSQNEVRAVLPIVAPTIEKYGYAL